MDVTRGWRWLHYPRVMFDWIGNLFADVEAQRMTLDGAALLATLYPIAILAALIDVRTITREPRVRVGKTKRSSGFGLYSRASAGWIAVATIPAMSAMLPLIQSVAWGRELTGWGVTWAALPGFPLFGALIALVIELVWLAFKADAEGPDGERAESQPASTGPQGRATRPARPGTAIKSRRTRKPGGK